MPPKIFFATRPIAPPWDEASKNMVFQMAKRLEGFTPIVLTHRNSAPPTDGLRIDWKPVYPRHRTREISWRQKVYFFMEFLRSDASIYHFYFTPEKYSSRILGFLKKFKAGKYLQTFATPIQNEKFLNEFAFGDAIVAQSDHSLRKLQEHGVDHAQRIYPAVDPDEYHPHPIPEDLKKTLGIQPGEKVVLFTGNYYLGCNDDLAETFIRLHRSDPQLRFIMACRIGQPTDLPKRDRFIQRMRQAGIQDKVIFFQTVDNMKHLLNLADAHLYPAHTLFGKADIPLVLIESLALEKPIIITDVAPLNEIMKDDVGIVVPTGDVDKLVEAVQTHLGDSNRAREQGRRGRQLVLREFSVDSYIRQYSKIYQSLLDQQL